MQYKQPYRQTDRQTDFPLNIFSRYYLIKQSTTCQTAHKLYRTLKKNQVNKKIDTQYDMEDDTDDFLLSNRRKKVTGNE